MLVLSRNAGESVWLTIGQVRVRIKVMDTSYAYGKKRAKLAFDAPDEVQILREELEERPCESKK